MAERPQGAVVDTTIVATQDVPRVLRAVGTVEAENETTVKAEVDGQVSRIVAEEGAQVQQGDVVLHLDPTPYRLAYQQAAAALNRSQATVENDARLLERYQSLLEAGAIDQQTYDDLEARVKAGQAQGVELRAQVNRANWMLSKSTIRAPFSGRVADRLVELGTYVASGDDLYQIVDARPVRVSFELPETSVGALSQGDAVSFTVRTDPGKVYEGEVIYISPSLNPETRTQTAKAEYPNESLEITPGSFADVAVTTEVREGAPVIPEEALVSEGEQSFVYVVEGTTASKREVTLGERLDQRLEVATGLEGGEVVVVAGQRELRDGAPIRYAERPAQAPGEVGPGREDAR
ncbi:MAG: efflux RND transporter periplasmic adaptor subunit [Gemmatimonadota bacterium]